MIGRILFSYLGAIGLPIIFLPLAMIFTVGGHSLMYVSLFGSPIGLLVALSYSDKRRHLKRNANISRTALGFGVYISFFVIVGVLSESSSSPFLKNQGWLFIVFLAPLFSALISEVLIKTEIT